MIEVDSEYKQINDAIEHGISYNRDDVSFYYLWELAKKGNYIACFFMLEVYKNRDNLNMVIRIEALVKKTEIDKYQDIVKSNLAKITERATANDTLAQYVLSVLLDIYHELIPPNSEQAVYWLERAAKQNCKLAQNALWTAKQDNSYFQQCKQLSEQNPYDPFYHYLLGEMYSEGGNVPKNAHAAYECYLRAADFGHVDAQFEVARINHFGLGVSKNMSVALKYYLLSAEQNNILACKSLSVLYENGEGVSKDLNLSAFYTRKSNKALHIADVKI